MKDKLYILACDFGVDYIGDDKELAQEDFDVMTKKRKKDCVLFEIDAKKI